MPNLFSYLSGLRTLLRSRFATPLDEGRGGTIRCHHDLARSRAPRAVGWDPVPKLPEQQAFGPWEIL